MNNLRYSHIIPSGSPSFLHLNGLISLLITQSFLSVPFLTGFPSGNERKRKKGILISTPTFKTTSKGIIVEVFYYVAGKELGKEPFVPGPSLPSGEGGDTKNFSTFYNLGKSSGKTHLILDELKIKSLSSLALSHPFAYPGEHQEGGQLLSSASFYPDLKIKSGIGEGKKIELMLVRQHSPYLNASILAQYLAINASKYGFHRIITLLLKAVPYFNTKGGKAVGENPFAFIEEKENKTGNPLNPILPQCTTGLKVQLSGLLTTQRNRARKTVYTASAGTLNSKVKTNKTFSPLALGRGGQSHIDYAESTSKSIVGTFQIKVWISSTV